MRALKLSPTPQRLLAAWLLCAATSGWTLELQKQEFSDEQIFSAIVNRFKKPLQHRFDPAATSDQKPVLLLGPALTFGKRMVSKFFTHVTQQELVAKQEAVFVLVTKAAPDREFAIKAQCLGKLNIPDRNQEKLKVFTGQQLSVI